MLAFQFDNKSCDSLYLVGQLGKDCCGSVVPPVKGGKPSGIFLLISESACRSVQCEWRSLEPWLHITANDYWTDRFLQVRRLWPLIKSETSSFIEFYNMVLQCKTSKKCWAMFTTSQQGVNAALFLEWTSVISLTTMIYLGGICRSWLKIRVLTFPKISACFNQNGNT